MLDYILANVKVTPAGISCNNVDTAYKLFKFLREAILDKHIPLRKAVGFQISAAKKLSYAFGDNVRLAHHPALGESYPELSKNLQDKIICTTTTEKDVQLELTLGENLLPNMTVYQQGKKLKILYENPVIATHIGDDGTFSGNTGPVLVQIRTERVIGYRSHADNSKIIPDAYFPCASDATLAPFVRVLPMMPGDTLIPMRFYNDFTPEEFMEMLQVWKTEFLYNGISKEETEWLQSFSM